MLECRIKEHKRDTKLGKTETSAVAEHAWNCDHQVDWKAVEVLDVEQRWGKQCTLESWHIHKEGHLVNKDKGTLPPIYSILQQP